VGERVASARLIGRAGEMSELEAALLDVGSGQPWMVFLTGESGVGKTRLLAEFEARAADSGARVLHGECLDLGEGELPYAPLLAALRPLARGHDDTLAELPQSARLELGRLLPGLGDGDGQGRAEEPAQSALFEALLTLLDRLGAQGPVVLAIEDVHWIDRSTRAFLTFLARSLRRERVLVVVTYRPDELHRRHPLRPLLAELERGGRRRRIELEPLTREELAEVLTDILGAAPAEDTLARLFARSEGNPLYAEELVAGRLDGRGPLPPTLRDAFMVRMEGLDEPAQAVLRAVAVAQRIRHEQLLELTGLAEPELDRAVREAVEGNVMVPDDEGRLRFRHALLREVAYEDVLPGERTRLHSAFAHLLEREAGDGAIAAVAHHHLVAGDQPAALAAAVRAADAAERVHAYDEAATQVERALELWPRVPDADALAGAARVDLLARAGRARLLADDPVRAEVLLRAALEGMDPVASPHRAAAVLGAMARCQWALNRSDEAHATARRALELLPEDEVSPERAGLLAWWARTRVLRGRYVEAIRAARKAIETAEAAGDELSRGSALNTLGVALAGRGEVDEGVAALREAIEIALDLDRPEEMCAAYGNLGDSLNLAGRTAEALEVAREGYRAVTERLGRRYDHMGVTVAEMAIDAGEWAEADTLLPPADAAFEGRERICMELRRAELALGRGDHEAAVHLVDIEELVAESTEAQYHGSYGALLAELRRREGDLDAARAAVGTALDRLEFCTDDVARIARVSAAGVAVEADRAQLMRDRGDTAGARSAVAGARSMLARVRDASESGGVVELAWLLTAQAELERARARPAPGRWARAADAWQAIARPYPAALARWREAEAHVEAGDRDAAGPPARLARRTADRLGAAFLTAEIESLAARARLSLAEDGPPGAAVPPAAGDPFGLTRRERQVLALLTTGATNREIGTTLYMAEKTASVHVSRILAKLNVRSRGQAAAAAHRLGLTGADGEPASERDQSGDAVASSQRTIRA
jgi:DNA-binding CsgD family transcriptional regulator/tetratricopeptide (TPR) repeat protein